MQGVLVLGRLVIHTLVTCWPATQFRWTSALTERIRDMFFQRFDRTPSSGWLRYRALHADARSTASAA
jgi:hypothetical protein